MDNMSSFPLMYKSKAKTQDIKTYLTSLWGQSRFNEDVSVKAQHRCHFCKPNAHSRVDTMAKIPQVIRGHIRKDKSLVQWLVYVLFLLFYVAYTLYLTTIVFCTLFNGIKNW